MSYGLQLGQDKRRHGLNVCIMGLSMLEYSKVILESVSFDPALFKKELIKAVNRLMDSEAEQLLTWCVARYQFP